MHDGRYKSHTWCGRTNEQIMRDKIRDHVAEVAPALAMDIRNSVSLSTKTKKVVIDEDNVYYVTVSLEPPDTYKENTYCIWVRRRNGARDLIRVKAIDSHEAIKHLPPDVVSWDFASKECITSPEPGEL